MNREYIESELKKGFEGLKKFIKMKGKFKKPKKYNRKERLINLQKEIKELIDLYLC